MNKYILDRLTYLYNTFAQMDRSDEMVLSKQMASKIRISLIEMHINYYGNYSKLEKEEFKLLHKFFKTCARFCCAHINIVTNIYKYSALHKCFKKMDVIYKSLMKYTQSLN